MQNQKHHAVIFDLGGVVFDSPIFPLEDYAKELTLSPDFFLKVIGYGGNTGSFIEFEKNLITEEEFVVKFAAECKVVSPTIPVDPRRIIDSLVALQPRKEMIYCINELRRKGVLVATITNNFKIGTLEEQEKRSAHLYDLFDVVVESCVVKMRKPNKEIFDHALNLIQESRENLKNITFEECIFLDDMGVNVKAALNFGIHTIKVEKNYIDAIKQVNALFPHLSLLVDSNSNL